MIERLFQPALETFTPHTPSKRSALLAEVRQARESRIAFSRNEFTPGISSMATVVSSSMGVYAFEVTLPDARFELRREEIQAAMLAHREQAQADSPAFERDRQASSLGLPPGVEK